MSTYPRISVIMPVYNGETYLHQAINSILAQTFTDYEFLIIDDGSTDASGEIANNSKDGRIRYIKKEHTGLVDTLNVGLNMARGEFIARIDSDDVACPIRFERQVEWLQLHKDIDLLCTDVVLIDAANNPIGMRRQSELTNLNLKKALTFQAPVQSVVPSTVMHRRELSDRVGLYRHYSVAEDHDYWLRCIKFGQFTRISDPLVKYRIHSDSISQTKYTLQCISIFMAVVNYFMEERYGVDFYVEFPDVFNDYYRKKVPTLVAQNCVPSARIGDYMLKRQWGILLWQIFHHTVTNRSIAWLPYLRRKRARKVVEAIISSLGEIPCIRERINS